MLRFSYGFTKNLVLCLVWSHIVHLLSYSSCPQHRLVDLTWYHTNQGILLPYINRPSPVIIRLPTVLVYSRAQYDTIQLYHSVQYNSSTIRYYSGRVQCYSSTVLGTALSSSVVLQYRVQFSTVHYRTVQSGIVQYSTVQYRTVKYSTTVQYSTVKYGTVQYYNITVVQYRPVQCSSTIQ